MHVVQQVDVGADGRAHRLEQLRRVAQVFLGRPVVLAGQVGIGRLVEHRAAPHAVDLLQPRHAALRADRLVAGLPGAAPPRRSARCRGRWHGIDHHAAAAGAAEQLVERHPGRLGLEVPQRGVDGGDRAHRHRPAPPVGAAVEVLPDVLDLVGVAADQAGHDVVGEVARHRQLAAVQRGVAQAGEALVGLDLEVTKLRPGQQTMTRGGDLHGRGGPESVKWSDHLGDAPGPAHAGFGAAGPDQRSGMGVARSTGTAVTLFCGEPSMTRSE